MSKLALSLVLVGALVSAGAVSLVGCRTDPPIGGPDMSISTGDGGGGGDMVTRNYTAATPNQIDTNAGGQYPKNTAVKLSKVVAVTPVTFFKSNSGARCDYEVWVQDAACTTPPCGLVVISKGPPPDSNDDCPFPNNAALMTPLKGIEMGDVLDVEGIVDTFVNGAVTQHEVEADTVTKTTGNNVITAINIPNCSGTAFAAMASGFTMYEGTVIKCTPANASAIVNGNNFYAFTFGGAQFSRTFSYAYSPQDASANDFPLQGMVFTSITGVVSNLFGGQILPRKLDDFTP